MPLKLNVPSLDDVPEAARGLYVQDGDQYKLEVDDAVPKVRFEEFRETNKAQRKKLEELENRYKGIDPEEVKSFREKYRDVDLEEVNAIKQELADLKNKDGKVKEQTKAELEKQIKELHDKHVKEMQIATANWEKEKGDRDALLTSREKALSTALIENQIATLSNENSVRPEALPDISSRGRNVFKLENGVVIPYRADGEKWFSDATGELMTMKEWFKLLLKEAPHLFRENTGTGANGAGTVHGGQQGKPEVKENPWQTGNRTKQGQIMKDDIAEARRLAQAAGYKRVPF